MNRPDDLQTEGIANLPRWIAKRGITVWNSVPTVFRSFVSQVQDPDQVASIRLLRLASDKVLPQDIEAYRRLFAPACKLWVCYALTEAKTVTTGFFEKEADIFARGIPSGQPIDGMEVRIVDEVGRLLGPDQVGEIIVRSRYVSPGYWNQPEINAERFLPDPNVPEIMTIHTGDLGKVDSDGVLFFVGRKDSQVKIRGHRVELGEIEARLNAVAGVKEAIVRAIPYGSDGMKVAAYVVSNTSPPPTVSTLRRVLRTHLPEYMIPTSFTFLDRIPLNRNGKIDRLALPAPGQARPLLESPFVAPQTPLEQLLTQIWRAVLGIESIGIHDAFLDLGGNSLQAMRIAARVQEEFSVEIPLAELFAAGTVAEMALCATAHLILRSDESGLAQFPMSPQV